MNVSSETAKTVPSAAQGQLLIYMDGRLVPKEQAVVSVFDHGLLYGDGVFEGIRAYGGRVFRLREHVERLLRSARAILLDVGLSREELEKAVLDTLRANHLKDGYVRLVATRGRGDLGLDPRKCPKPTLFIIADKITLYPEASYTQGLSIVTVSTRRNSLQALNPNIKSLNYLNNVLAKLEANQANAPEAIMLNDQGYVAECTADNVFYVRGSALVTPPTSAGALEGITRACVMDLARGLGLSVEERLFTPFDLFTADEVFLTGTAVEVIPVVRVDARPVGASQPGPTTQKLIRAFRELVAREGTPI